MSVKKFEELEVWIASKELAVLIYKATESDCFRRDYSLKDQIRRASISLVSNIAEGFERNGNKEFIQFLSIAKGSAGEIRAQLYVIMELGYIEQQEFETLNEKATAISKMLSGFINYLKQSELKGTKFITAR